jgi:hypothetical protein
MPILPLLLLLAAPPLAKDGYQRTRWGMSVAQVKELYPKSMDADEARKLKPGAFDAKEQFVLAETTILGRKAWATFRFAGGGLSEVSVRPELERADECTGIDDALTEKYGQPKKHDSSDGKDVQVLNGTWENGSTRIELACSSIKTEAALAKMKKESPDTAFPDEVPADAVEMTYRKK